MIAEGQGMGKEQRTGFFICFLFLSIKAGQQMVRTGKSVLLK